MTKEKKTGTNVSATNPKEKTGTDTEFNNFVVAPVNVELISQRNYLVVI